MWFNCSCGSTLLLLQGQYDWYDPKKSMTPAAASLFNRLAGQHEMPYLPSSVMEIQAALSDPEISSSELAEAIRRDPLIAAQILSLSNNLKAPTGERVTSIEHAVVFVGRKTVGELVLIAATKLLKFATNLYLPEQFWLESLTAGSCAQAVVERFKFPMSPDEAYLAAALANVGKVVGAIWFPELTDKIYKETVCAVDFLPWNEAERRTGGIDHKMLGEIGLCIWGMPTFIIECARKHHDPPLIGASHTNLSNLEVVAFSIQLSHLLLGQQTRVNRELLLGFGSRISLDASAIEHLVSDFKKRGLHRQTI